MEINNSSPFTIIDIMALIEYTIYDKKELINPKASPLLLAYVNASFYEYKYILYMDERLYKSRDMPNVSNINLLPNITIEANEDEYKKWMPYIHKAIEKYFDNIRG